MIPRIHPLLFFRRNKFFKWLFNTFNTIISDSFDSFLIFYVYHTLKNSSYINCVWRRRNLVFWTRKRLNLLQRNITMNSVNDKLFKSFKQLSVEPWNTFFKIFLFLFDSLLDKVFICFEHLFVYFIWKVRVFFGKNIQEKL